MLTDARVFALLRENRAAQLHQELDDALGSASESDLNNIAHWRTHAFEREKRYEDAIVHLEKSKQHFFCKTLAHHEKAELLDCLGRNADAQVELEGAPFEAEADRFPVLVADARFFLLLLRVRGGYRPLQSELDCFPDDFGTVLMPGRPFSKADLLSMISHDETS
jgi:hypothetical protein